MCLVEVRFLVCYTGDDCSNTWLWQTYLRPQSCPGFVLVSYDASTLDLDSIHYNLDRLYQNGHIWPTTPNRHPLGDKRWPRGNRASVFLRSLCYDKTHDFWWSVFRCPKKGGRIPVHILRVSAGQDNQNFCQTPCQDQNKHPSAWVLFDPRPRDNRFVHVCNLIGPRQDYNKCFWPPSSI